MPDKIKKSLILNILLVFFVAVVGYSAFNMARQAVDSGREARTSEEKIKELVKKKEELEAYLVELQTPEAVEREVKERLNLKKKGEEVVVVVPEEKKKIAIPEQTWWQKIKLFFAVIFNAR